MESIAHQRFIHNFDLVLQGFRNAANEWPFLLILILIFIILVDFLSLIAKSKEYVLLTLLTVIKALIQSCLVLEWNIEEGVLVIERLLLVLLIVQMCTPEWKFSMQGSLLVLSAGFVRAY
ncbi:unnamed protein product [Mucor circinelloides]